jgi:hypothetical protein
MVRGFTSIARWEARFLKWSGGAVIKGVSKIIGLSGLLIAGTLEMLEMPRNRIFR